MPVSLSDTDLKIRKRYGGKLEILKDLSKVNTNINTRSRQGPVVRLSMQVDSLEVGKIVAGLDVTNPSQPNVTY